MPWWLWHWLSLWLLPSPSAPFPLHRSKCSLPSVTSTCSPQSRAVSPAQDADSLPLHFPFATTLLLMLGGHLMASTCLCLSFALVYSCPLPGVPGCEAVTVAAGCLLSPGSSAPHQLCCPSASHVCGPLPWLSGATLPPWLAPTCLPLWEELNRGSSRGPGPIQFPLKKKCTADPTSAFQQETCSLTEEPLCPLSASVLGRDPGRHQPCLRSWTSFPQRVCLRVAMSKGV